MQNRHISRTKAKRLAARLLRDKRPWRKIAKDDYGDRVHFALLCKFAQRRGEWLPKDEAILDALGLITKRSPYAIMPRYFNRSPEALHWFLNKRQLAKGIAEDTKKAQKGR